jgi:hypothetical protein
MEIQHKNRQGILLTASCLKSRWSWLYGQLWLFSDGLLRLPLPWWTGISQMYAYRPTITPGHLESLIFDEHDVLKLTLNPKNLWIPRNQITRASLGGDTWTERLSAELIDGRVVKLFWMRPDNASEPLGKALSSWLGSSLIWEERRGNATIPER